jgi:ABC-type polysaccharide/polyol phosphate export permease
MHHDLELLLAMTEREIKARYKHALLGFLWILLNPLLQMCIIGVVFSFVFHVAISDYFLFLFSGLLIWDFFSLTFTKITPSIVNEQNLIKKSAFRREVIILSIIFSHLFHVIVAFLLFSVLLMVMGRLNVIHWLFLPVPLLWVTVLVTGLGLLTSALNTKYRDVNFFVQAIVPLWFYATPIIYATSIIPKELAFFLYLNPMVGIIELVRWSLLQASLPSTLLLLSNLSITVVIFVIGYWVFQKNAPFFDDWI